MGGAAVSCLNAWRFALVGTVGERDASEATLASIVVPRFAAAIAAELAQNVADHTQTQGFQRDQVHIRYILLHGPGIQDGQLNAWGPPPRPPVTDRLVATGWPFKALSERGRFWSASSGAQWEWSWWAPPWDGYLGWELAPGSASRPPLPLRPIPLGFAADTVFYAVMLAGLFSAPRAIRTRVRLCRGLCPACGYDLTGNTTGVCLECGNGKSE